jgi:hypothetical protein
LWSPCGDPGDKREDDEDMDFFGAKKRRRLPRRFRSCACFPQASPAAHDVERVVGLDRQGRAAGVEF